MAVWLQDEVRFGQQGTRTRVGAERGTRPRACRQTEYAWVCLFGSVRPSTGDAHGRLLPAANRDAMEQCLADFSRHLQEGVHALLVLDGAGWPTSGRLRVPDHGTLPRLPAKSPELNPAEQPWREIRRKYLGNRLFPRVENLDDAIADARMQRIKHKTKIQALCAYDWIMKIVQN